ncbi:vacuolar sorting-associated protein 26 [Babesia caballi]|uniref:Vacuolar sorting-associated protein 26 n=1 Tax=Babesia caballi TaxID=5871 RepID=A0AAV4LMY9_BABCB|nr:vacuolar sorting-associated protein 26 [Babesia caballi]
MAGADAAVSSGAPAPARSARLAELRRLQHSVNCVLQDLYAGGAFGEIQAYVERELKSLDMHCGYNYSHRADDVLRAGNRGRPPRAEGRSRSRSDAGGALVEHFLLSHVEPLRTLVFTRRVRAYQHSYSNEEAVDLLLLTHDLYTTLHLASLDARMHLNAWDDAITALLHLGVVSYFIRCDLAAALRGHAATGSDNGAPELGADRFKALFQQRGIYIKDGEDRLVECYEILEHVLAGFIEELSLELWSRMVLLWLRDTSLFRVLDTLERLPLAIRSQLFRRARRCFHPLNLSVSKAGKRGYGGDPASFTTGVQPHVLMHAHSSPCAVPYSWAVGYLLSSSSSGRRYALEGWLMLAKLAADIDREFHISACFTIYIVARIISSEVRPFDDPGAAGSQGERQPGSPELKPAKEPQQPSDHSWRILQYAAAQHWGNLKSFCVMSGVDQLWVKRSGRWLGVNLTPISTFSWFARYANQSWLGLEFALMSDVDRIIPCTARGIDNVSFAPALSVEEKALPSAHIVVDHRDLEHLDVDAAGGCASAVHLDHLVVNGHALEMSLDFNPMCTYLASRHKRPKRYRLLPSQADRLSFKLSTKRPEFAKPPAICGLDSALLLALLAFCVAVDREYAMLHFRQSLDCLNYRDTLRKKRKMFLRKVMPWVPVPNRDEARRMTRFQRLIRGSFMKQAWKSYAEATGLDHVHDLQLVCAGCASTYMADPKEAGVMTMGSYISMESGELVQQADNAAFKCKTTSRLQDGFYEVLDRSKSALSQARCYLYSRRAGSKPLCGMVSMFNGYYRLLDKFPFMTDDRGDGEAARLREPRCEHVAVQPAIDSCDTCFARASFTQLDRVILLVDWISHYVFTNSVRHDPIFKRTPPIAAPCDSVPVARPYTVVDDYEGFLQLNSLEAVLRGGDRSSKMMEHVMHFYSTNPTSATGVGPWADRLSLLNEVVESAMLVSLATCFHERTYIYLVLNLALLQALQGRWNLCFSLVKQLRDCAREYNTPFGCNSLSAFGNVPRLAHIETVFISHLTAKILTELAGEPRQAIEQLSGEHVGASDAASAATGDAHVEADSESRATSAKSLLLLGASYLKLGDAQVHPFSAPISDYATSLLHLTDTDLAGVRYIDCTGLDYDVDSDHLVRTQDAPPRMGAFYGPAHFGRPDTFRKHGSYAESDSSAELRLSRRLSAFTKFANCDEMFADDDSETHQGTEAYEDASQGSVFDAEGEADVEVEAEADAGKVPDGDYPENRVATASQYILKSLSVDPLSSKAWVYLAHCAILAHEYDLAYACSKRSVECYDACLPGWLTMAVALSTLGRSAAPARVTRPVWHQYLVSKRREREKRNPHEGASAIVTVDAFPVPFDPVFPSRTETVGDLEEHLNKAVGGNLAPCLDVLVASTRFGSAFSYAGALQLVFRTAEGALQSFPWEALRSSVWASRVNKMELYLVLLMSIKCASQLDIADAADEWVQHGDSTISLKMASLVAQAVAHGLFVSSVPFLRALCLMFSLDVVDHHRAQAFGDKTRPEDGLGAAASFEEEAYGWITCIETLAQSGHASMAALFMPLLECFLDADLPRCCEAEYSGSSDDKIPTPPYAQIYRLGGVKRHFGGRAVAASDLRAEVAFLRLYVSSFLTPKESLGGLLADIRAGISEHHSRKLRLLEAQVLAGMQRHSEAARLYESLLRRGFIAAPSTDYLLEWRAMRVYTSVLNTLGELNKSFAVSAFADQCLLTVPQLRIDLCLLPPL